MKKLVHIILSLLSLIILFLWFFQNETNVSFLKKEPFRELEILSASGEVTLLKLEKNVSVTEIIDETLSEFEVRDEQVAIAYYDFLHDDHYYLNENRLMDAASTSKIAIAALFIDLISSGELTWETSLPYYDHFFEDGFGTITESEKKDSYQIEELLYDMLTHSDNTATNILANFYIDHYSESFYNYRQDILAFSGLKDLPADVYETNSTTAYILEQLLLTLADNDAYTYIFETLLSAQNGERLKTYVTEGMAAKSGTSSDYQSEHDILIHYSSDGTPRYILVVMTNNLSDIDDFMGTMNLRIYHSR